MSFTNAEMNRAARQALRRQKVALYTRLRQNLFLKIVALVSAIMLYIFVQTERNPMITRALVVDVVRDNLPEKVEVDGLPRQLAVSVTGPRYLVQNLAPNDIRAVTDFSNAPVNSDIAQHVNVTFHIPGYTRDMAQQITFDTPASLFRVQLYPEETRTLTVHAVTSREAPFGSHYGKPQISPTELMLSGRRDQVEKVVRLEVTAFPTDASSNIDGDFPVTPKDKEGHEVENVTLSQPNVHVTLPLRANPPSKIVFVSPRVTELPALPAVVETMTLTPRQVKVVGKSALIELLDTVQTEPISLRDYTRNHEMDVDLDLPEGVKAEDLNGKPVKQIHLRFNISKATTPPPTPTPAAPTAPSGGSVSPP